MSINEDSVFIKVKSNTGGGNTLEDKLSMYRDLKGKLVAYDQHLNVMMTDCEETIYSPEKDA